MTSNGAGYLNEIFNKRNFKYSGAMLWNNLSCEEKQDNRFSNSKPNLPLCLLLDRSDSITCMCMYFKLILVTLPSSHHHIL